MEVTKKLNPGARGTHRYIERYGNQLICVRYRRDPARNRMLTTVEIIVEERTRSFASEISGPHPNAMIYLRIAYGETELREKVKAVGGRWDRTKRLWRLGRHQALALGLRDRIVDVDLAS